MGDIPQVGVDLGYGRVKVAGPGFRHSFAAVVADAGVNADLVGEVRIGGHRYLVGDAALADPSHRYASSLDKIRTEDELAKYCAALAVAATQYDCKVLAVTTGLPPAQWRDPLQRQQIEQRLAGEFRFSYEGKPYCIDVSSVTVDPQAGAAFYDFLLVDDGETARTDLLNMQTLILDIGHNTTDIAMFKGRKAAFGRDSLKTALKGVWHVYEEMQRLMLQEYRLPLLSAAAIDPIWRAGGIKLAGQWNSIGPLKARAAEPIARAILAEVERAAGDLRLWDAVLVTGGGAQVLADYLPISVPVIKAQDPAYGNAAGYFKRQMERSRVGA